MAKKYVDFLDQVDNWTLLQDSLLITCLQNNTNNILNYMKELESLEKQLETDSTKLIVRLENVFNNISALKLTKFVEERIEEEQIFGNINKPVTKLLQTDMAKHQEHTTIAIKSAIQNGLQTIGQNFNEVSIASQIPNSSQMVYQPKNLHQIRLELPPIIGSAKFYSSSMADLNNLNNKFTNQSNSSISNAPDDILTNFTKKNAEDESFMDHHTNRSSSLKSTDFDDIPKQLNIVEPFEQSEKLSLASEFWAGEFSTEITEKPEILPFSNEPTKLTNSLKQNSIPTETIKSINSLTASTKAKSKQEEILEEDPQPIIITPVKTHVIKPSTSQRVRSSKLFSSSSESEEEQQSIKVHISKPIENLKDKRVQVVDKVTELNSSEIIQEEDFQSQNQLLKSTPIKGEEEIIQVTKDIDEYEDMTSKPVLNNFDATFSDRLAMAIRNGPTLRRNDGPTLTKRPVSIASIPNSDSEENFNKSNTTFNRSQLSTEQRSSVSSNEEFGSTTVASRIAQIGNKIPLKGNHHRSSIESLEKSVSFEKPAILPQINITKERPKGPKAKRAPIVLTKASVSNIPANEQTSLPPLPTTKAIVDKNLDSKSKTLIIPSKKTDTKSLFTDNDKQASTEKLPPNSNIFSKNSSRIDTLKQSAAQKKKVKSIFDSTSSSDEDLGKIANIPSSNSQNSMRKNTSGTQKTDNIKDLTVLTKTQVFNKPTKQIEKTQGSRKGLFDDSDSDI